MVDADSSVFVYDDPTSRGSTAAAADTTAADPQSSAAPSAAPAAESTHVTPGNVCSVMFCVRSSPIWTTRRGLCVLLTHISLPFLQQQIQEVFKNQQEQLSMQLLQQKNAGIVSQEVTSYIRCCLLWGHECLITVANIYYATRIMKSGSLMKFSSASYSNYNNYYNQLVVMHSLGYHC